MPPLSKTYVRRRLSAMPFLAALTPLLPQMPWKWQFVGNVLRRASSSTATEASNTLPWLTVRYLASMAFAKACPEKEIPMTTRLLKISSAVSSVKWSISKGFLPGALLKPPSSLTLKPSTTPLDLTPPWAGSPPNSFNTSFNNIPQLERLIS